MALEGPAGPDTIRPLRWASPEHVQEKTMMGEGNQIGVLIELILTHVFPEACPDTLGEHIVQHPDAHPRNLDQ